MKNKSEEVLKVDRMGRVRTPRAIREAALDEFERSGMPGTQFAARIGVKYQTFATWAQTRRKQRGNAAQTKWVEAVAANETGALEAGVSIATAAAICGAADEVLTVLLPGGARIEICRTKQVSLAAVLLRELSAGGAAC